MANNFLTPTAIWKGFKCDGAKAEIIHKSTAKGLTFTHLRIGGSKAADGETGIYAVLTHKAQLSLSSPAIVLVQDFGESGNAALPRLLAEKGYTVLDVDLAGKAPFNLEKTVDGVDKPYTVYPDSLSYANYDKSTEEKTEIEGDVRSTCWFEWGRVVRYCIEYLKAQPFINKIGVFAIGGAATAVWQTLSSDCGLSCAVIVANAGWKGYRGIDKFGDEKEPQFNDDALKYLAGIEPQAYAAHVKCPLMLVSPTNSPDYDVDRAYDTVSRVSEKLYTAVDYSVGGRREINAECMSGALVFLNEFLVKDKASLAGEISLKSAAENGILRVEVMPDKAGLKNLSVFFAEEELHAALRSWRRVVNYEKAKNGVYVFEYAPYKDSEAVMFFARAEYENGLNICSPIFCKKFLEGETAELNRHRVFYSSRMSLGTNGFYPATENSDGAYVVNTDAHAVVKVKNGPMDIAGLFCPKGILTFKVNAVKYKPSEGAIMMLDVFVKNDCDLHVKAITDYFGNKTEYVAGVKLFGNLWQNVKLENNNFKTAEGMSLKTYEHVEALEISADEEFLINNLLWV